MVSNKEWNRGFSSWKEKIRKWFANPDPKNTLEVGIFFDFRNVFGDQNLTERLRDFIFSEITKGDLFISYMLLDAVRMRAPTGFLRWITSRIEGKKKEAIDIKKYGIFPITHGVRALALREKIRRTETTDRIDILIERNVLPPDLGEDIKEAFSFLQTIRLRHQLELIKDGKKPDNDVIPGKLGKLERELLKDSMKIVADFQDFIERRYTAILPQ